VRRSSFGYRTRWSGHRSALTHTRPVCGVPPGGGVVAGAVPGATSRLTVYERAHRTRQSRRMSRARQRMRQRTGRGPVARTSDGSVETAESRHRCCQPPAAPRPRATATCCVHHTATGAEQPHTWMELAIAPHSYGLCDRAPRVPALRYPSLPRPAAGHPPPGGLDGLDEWTAPPPAAPPPAAPPPTALALAALTPTLTPRAACLRSWARWGAARAKRPSSR